MKKVSENCEIDWLFVGEKTGNVSEKHFWVTFMWNFVSNIKLKDTMT